METLVVVTKDDDWPLEVPGVRVMSAVDYLSSPQMATLRHAKVFNLCRHYRYQAFGYFVSLLAEARGHKPVPTVQTMQDMRYPTLIRIASEEIEDLIQKTLQPVADARFTLYVYFGSTVDPAMDRLGTALYRHFTAPFLRATFHRTDRWHLHNVSPIAMSAIPDQERAAALAAARAFFTKGVRPQKAPRPSRFDLAILYDPTDNLAPSDPKAIQKFVAAAEDLDISSEVIGKEDAGRLLEFDALFIRSTTAVDHHTYRMARRAAAEGLVVIDDPLSILRCTNKVFQAEMLACKGLSAPKTIIVNRNNKARVVAELGLPCVVKQPDSSSSLGVFKAETPKELDELLDRLLSASDLVIAQEFVPTEFDWRIGVLDRRPLFAVRYYMAPKHWQIIHHAAPSDRTRYGKWDTVPVEEVPTAGIELAVNAARAIGDGLYGVDVKQIGSRWVVIEVNDNPNIEHTVEDAVLKDDLYRRVMQVFLRRLEAVTEARIPR